MVNTLQVINPSPNTDNRTLDNQEARNHLNGQRTHNLVDLTRVVRADRQGEGRTGTAIDEGKYSITDYENNYGALVQRLGGNVELPRLLEQLLFGSRAGVLFVGQEEAGTLVEQLLSSVQVDSSETLREFLMEQQTQQARFSDSFFAGLRGLLTRGASDGLKGAVMAFIKGSNDYPLGHHLSQQVHSPTRDISRSMLKNYETDFWQLMSEMDQEAGNGDTATNTAILNERLIPLLSNYISRTHDYGAVREAVMPFILHAVKYENGQEDRFMQLFERTTENREFEQLFAGDTRDGFANTPEGLDQRPDGFTDIFPALVLKGTNGQAGTKNIQPFHNILDSMPLNESVYLPLLYILMPFCYQGRDVMSEIWVDLDAGGQKENGRRVKTSFKFHIRELGRFDMILTFQGWRVEMQLYVPLPLAEGAETIQGSITKILRENGADLNRLLVQEKTGDIRLGVIFPGIRKREKGINVRI